MQTVENYLSGKSYPGRGIFIGHVGDITVSAYFIMGRSENSRNRVFRIKEDTLFTEAFDPSKLADPSLIIYNCTKSLGALDIITNGDHTDTVYDFIEKGDSFENAMYSRRYEPDPPNYTPRIAGIACSDNSKFGICRAQDIELQPGDVNPGDVRCFFSYAKKEGTAHIIHTYRDEQNGVLQPFIGEPVELSLQNDSIDSFTDKLWSSLNADNRVSLFVRYRNNKTKQTETRIVNSNK